MLRKIVLLLLIITYHLTLFSQVDLVLPKNGSVLKPTPVTFSWNAYSSASNYNLQLAIDSNFTTLVLDQSNLNLSNFNYSGLIDNQQYYWRVKANNSNWSPTHSFKTVQFKTWPQTEMILDPDSIVLDANGKVQQWTDLSGKGNHFTQIDLLKRPSTNIESIENNQQTIDFNPSNQEYLNGPDLSALSQGEIYVILKRHSFPPSSSVNTGIWNFGTATDNSHFTYTDSKIYEGFGRNVRLNVGNYSSSYDFENPLLINVSSSSNFKFSINKDEVYSTSIGSVSFTEQTIIGKSRTSYYFDGSFGQILLFNTVLSDSLRNIVYDFYRYKYAPPINLGQNISIQDCNDETILYPNHHFTSLLWSDGSTADSLIIEEPGTYWVEATDIFGNISSDTISVTLDGLTYPSQQQFCSGETVVWNTNLAPGFTCLWSDGSTADSLIISTTGDYSVAVSDNNGCIFYSDTLHFTQDDFANTAGLGGADTNLCVGNTLFLSSGAEETVSYLWNTGATTPSIPISQSGTYSVTITNINGCEAQDQIDVTIVGDAPQTAFILPENGCRLAPFSYQDATQTTDGSTIVDWEWNFGDGNSATTASGTHQYAVTGMHEITLLVTTSSGCKGFAKDSLEVKSLPIATISSDLHCQFDSIAFLGGQNTPTIINEWVWNFGDENSSTNTAQGQSATHVYNNSGLFNASLVVTDMYGCVDTATQIILIDPTPIVDFSFTPVCEGSVVDFNNETTIASPGEISAYTWNFGDGTQSGQTDPQKPYTVYGEYVVSLSALSNLGCFNSTSQPLKIHAYPIVDYSITQNCEGLETQFKDESYIPNGSVAQVDWTIENEMPITGFDVFKNFDNDGIYDLKQTVSSAFGCVTSETSTITIHEALKAQFSFNPQALLVDYPIQFHNESIGATQSFWTFGNGVQSQALDTTLIFEESWLGDTLLLQLNVENSWGCVDSAVQFSPVLLRHTDLALTQIFAQEENGFLTLGVTLFNKGTTPITAIDLMYNSPEGNVMKETWTGLLSAGTSENYVFAFSPSFIGLEKDSLNNYVCIRGIIKTPTEFKELDMDNNTVCKVLTPAKEVIVNPYPNPIQNKLNIQVVVAEDTKGSIYIYDPLGKRMYTVQENANLQKGLNLFTINTSHWVDGWYTIQYVGENEVKSIRFVKMK